MSNNLLNGDKQEQKCKIIILQQIGTKAKVYKFHFNFFQDHNILL
jgi:hypothetical protein